MDLFQVRGCEITLRHMISTDHVHHNSEAH